MPGPFVACVLADFGPGGKDRRGKSPVIGGGGKRFEK